MLLYVCAGVYFMHTYNQTYALLHVNSKCHKGQVKSSDARAGEIYLQLFFEICVQPLVLVKNIFRLPIDYTEKLSYVVMLICAKLAQYI